MTQMPPELVVFVGLPGAGKSRFYRAHFAATHVLISKDLWPNLRDKNRRQETLAREYLSAGQSVVADNTNASRAERAQLLVIARACSARVSGYYFEVTVEQSQARNATREGRARVPDVAIFVTQSRLQIPTLAEGFDALLRVTLAPNGAPIVWPWKTEADEFPRI